MKSNECDIILFVFSVVGVHVLTFTQVLRHLQSSWVKASKTLLYYCLDWVSYEENRYVARV